MKFIFLYLFICIQAFQIKQSISQSQTVPQFENITFNLKQEFYNTTNFDYFKCNDSIIDCSNAGVCSPDKDECVCFEGYRTVFILPEDYFSTKPRCNYLLKSQLYAMVLALFPSSGFLHFYLGHYIVGFVQLTLFIFVLIFNVTVITVLSLKHIKKVSQVEYRGTLSIMLVVCFFSLISFFWYLFDLFMILFNVYKDKQNVELQTFFSQ